MEHFLRILGSTKLVIVEQVGLDLGAALVEQLLLTSRNYRFVLSIAKVQMVSIKCRRKTVNISWWADDRRKHRLLPLRRSVTQAIEHIDRLIHKLMRRLQVADLAVDAF